MGELNVDYILQTMMTSLENSLTGESLSAALKENSQKPHFMYFQDCINRYSSVSSVVIQGVRKNERPEYTTMWSKIGFPLGAMVIPVLLNKAGDLPETATASGSENALVCDKALMLKKIMVPIRRGSGKYYIDITKVVNIEQTGILQRLSPVNEEIIGQTHLKMAQWRGKPLDPAEVKSFYDWLDRKVIDSYKQLFGI